MQLTFQQKLTPRWGTLIKRYRLRSKMTRKEWAASFGVTPQATRYWEQDRREPPAVLTWMIYKELEKKHAQK